MTTNSNPITTPLTRLNLIFFLLCVYFFLTETYKNSRRKQLEELLKESKKINKYYTDGGDLDDNFSTLESDA